MERDKIVGVGGLIILSVLMVVAFVRINSTYDLELAYDTYIDTPVVRNEWGQRPNIDYERMCSATILQWSEWCK